MGSTAKEPHQRIADCRRLRTMTWDAQALEAIDEVIAETEEQLREPEGPRTDRAAHAGD